jgi:hypothetical protein
MQFDIFYSANRKTPTSLDHLQREHHQSQPCLPGKKKESSHILNLYFSNARERYKPVVHWTCKHITNKPANKTLAASSGSVVVLKTNALDAHPISKL